jgi:hypothetical protein
MLGLTCPSASFCAGMGSFQDTSLNVWGTLDVLNGTTWSSEQAPLPANAASSADVRLGSVSCADDTFCVVVGVYFDGAHNTDSLIETYSGGVWSVQEAPEPSDSTHQYSFLSGVSCPAVGVCYAVGNYIGSGPPLQPYIDTLAGGTWTSAPAPLPSGWKSPGTAFEYVSCPTTSFCGADASTSAPDNLFLQMVDGVWSSQAAPVPANASTALSEAGNQIESLSCADSMCEATGFYINKSNREQMLLEYLPAPGGLWSVSRGPLPTHPMPASDPNAIGAGVSCTSDGLCTVVGSYTDSGGRFVPLVESVSNGVATPFAGALPSGYAGSYLTAVSCLGGGQCTAVGAGGPIKPGQTGLIQTGVIEQLMGSTSRALAAPMPSDAEPPPPDNLDNFLAVVSCAAASTCEAAGSYDNMSGAQERVVEAYANSSTTAG